MIAYDLMCECGYTFEGWFRDSDDFIKQQSSGLITCPGCEKTNTVRKILSPVALHTRDRYSESNIQRSQKEIELSKDVESAIQTLRMLQEYVERNFKDVGTAFAEKTLKIHYGIEEPQDIRGVVSEDEEKVLTKEGITLLKIPMLKKDQNSGN